MCSGLRTSASGIHLPRKPSHSESKTYEFDIREASGAIVTKNLPYYCGINIIACTADIDRSPNGAVKLFKGDGVPTGGIGVVLDDSVTPRTVARTSTGHALGGFGYSTLFDRDVVTHGVIIEPNDAVFGRH